MALSNAERQAQWREKRNKLAVRAEELDAEVARLKAQLADVRSRQVPEPPKPAKQASVKGKVRASKLPGAKEQVEAFCDKHGIPPAQWNAIYDRLHSDWWESLSFYRPKQIAEMLCKVLDDLDGPGLHRSHSAKEVANAMLTRPWH